MSNFNPNRGRRGSTFRMILIQIGNLSSLSCPNNVFPEAEVRIMVFNSTFNSISVISWQSLLMEETEVPGLFSPSYQEHSVSCFWEGAIMVVIVW
jgi:hypothetical protein